MNLISELIEILKLDVRKILLTTVLSIICIGGVIQTYAFIDDVPGIPKPPLYDLFKPLNFWTPWILFTAPLHILGYVLNLYGLIEYFPELGAGLKFPLLSIIYTYLVSSVAITTYDRWLRNTHYKGLPLILGIIIAIIFNPPFIVTLNLDFIVFMVSGFLFLTLIFTVLIIATYGVFKILRSLSRI